ncbi:MAG TPA: biopolymer transporter ExbD [Allosphingosinicella sp.]|nr:biopolymer transporter ExbD [Allosphingosinicella sp.]
MDLPASTFEPPAAAGRRAQLLLALLLLSVFPAFLLTIPIQTHSVKIDLPRLPEAIFPPTPSEPETYLMAASIMAPIDFELESPRRLHKLVVTPQDTVLFNGRAVDLAGLRSSLEIVEANKEWVDFRPEPNARYEMVIEVLAVTRRARLERLRLDSRPFRDAIEKGSARPYLSI